MADRKIRCAVESAERGFDLHRNRAETLREAVMDFTGDAAAFVGHRRAHVQPFHAQVMQEPQHADEDRRAQHEEPPRFVEHRRDVERQCGDRAAPAFVVAARLHFEAMRAGRHVRVARDVFAGDIDPIASTPSRR